MFIINMEIILDPIIMNHYFLCVGKQNKVKWKYVAWLGIRLKDYPLRSVGLSVVLMKNGGAQAHLLTETFCVRFYQSRRDYIIQCLKSPLIFPYQSLGGKIFFKAFYKIRLHCNVRPLGFEPRTLEV